MLYHVCKQQWNLWHNVYSISDLTALLANDDMEGFCIRILIYMLCIDEKLRKQTCHGDEVFEKSS
jgi:hypothetical protein